MASKSSEQSRKNASYLREHKVQRTAGMCPWGCGRTVTNGGQPLITHLNFCKGRRK